MINIAQFQINKLDGAWAVFDLRDNHFKETKKQDNFTVVSHENIYGEDVSMNKYAILMPFYMDMYYNCLRMKFNVN